jgi:hypothetical protein
MGESIDLNLFTGSDTTFQQETGSEGFWFEAERFVSPGSRCAVVSDAAASNGKYITVQPEVQSLSAAPTDSAGVITIVFTIGYREDGACLDKVCISNSSLAPTGLGEADPATL